ncbi:MAG TPA: hypothetical protein VFD72_04780 [Sphingobacteriaceae bacterium]|nr:hypothetical protein [Sphingobacteriaceae bacterium]
MKTKKNQKIKFACFAILILSLFLSTQACKKKENSEPDNQTGTGAVPMPFYPNPSDADAVLIAVKSSVPSPVQIPGMSMGITIDFGMGIAVFKGNTKADKVSLNNTELTFTNGVHTWLPNFKNALDPTALTGINLDGDITWNVTNPTIQKTLSSLPGKPEVLSGKTITKSEGYVISNRLASGAQHVLYAIHANNKTVMKTLSGNSTSCTFTAAELAELGTTKNAIVQANAYRISDEMIGGKKVYFVRQSSYSVTSVEIN